MKNGEGSLVIGGGDKQAAETRSADSLHTMLSREVEVYVFRGATRVFPQTPLAPARLYPPDDRWQRAAGPYLETLIQKIRRRHGTHSWCGR